jgi:hypothetical protein
LPLDQGHQYAEARANNLTSTLHPVSSCVRTYRKRDQKLDRSTFRATVYTNTFYIFFPCEERNTSSAPMLLAADELLVLVRTAFALGPAWWSGPPLMPCGPQ